MTCVALTIRLRVMEGNSHLALYFRIDTIWPNSVTYLNTLQVKTRIRFSTKQRNKKIMYKLPLILNFIQWNILRQQRPPISLP